MSKADFEQVTITAPNGRSQFTIAPQLGGMGTSLILTAQGQHKELLYLPDNFWELADKKWQGGWPFCFPICGRNTCGSLPMHGFACDMPWQVCEQGDDHLTIELTHTDATLAVYPYEFSLRLAYRISNDTLYCQQTVTNLSKNDMPYYAGFHPYFLTPLASKTQTTVNFSSLKRKQYNDALTDIIGDLPALSLPQAITNPELNEQLSVLSNNVTELRYQDGLKITISVAGVEREDMYAYVQMYTQPDKPFFCIEPWMNYPNALNHKNDLIKLKPKMTENAELIVKLS